MSATSFGSLKTGPLTAALHYFALGSQLYSPLKYNGLAEPGKHIGVVGLGGLGHVAVKFKGFRGESDCN